MDRAIRRVALLIADQYGWITATSSASGQNSCLKYIRFRARWKFFYSPQKIDPGVDSKQWRRTALSGPIGLGNSIRRLAPTAIHVLALRARKRILKQRDF